MGECEQDESLLESEKVVDAKIRRGLAELDRGEGVLDDELDKHPQRDAPTVLRQRN